MTEIADRESFELGLLTAWLLLMATFLLTQTTPWFIYAPTPAEFAVCFSRPLFSLREVAIVLFVFGIVTLGVLLKSRGDNAE